MLSFLFLLACSQAPTETADAPAAEEPAAEAPAKKGPAKKTKGKKAPVPKAAWVGDWVMGDKILATDEAGEMKLMWEGDVVMSGPMKGKGLRRTAPLDGCGATLKLSEVGGDVTVALDGPECPVDFAGTYVNTASP